MSGGGAFAAVQLTYRRWTERARLGIGKHHKKLRSSQVGFIFHDRYTTCKKDRAARNNNNKSGNTAVVVKTAIGVMVRRNAFSVARRT